MHPDNSVCIEGAFYMGMYFKCEGVLYTLKGTEVFIHSLFIFTAIDSLTLSEFSRWSGLDFTATAVLHSLGRAFVPFFLLHSAFGALTTRWVKQVLAVVSREHLEDIKSCSLCPFPRFLIL